MSDETKHLCEACGSPDTVSYWDTKAGQPPVAEPIVLVTVYYIHKHYYPGARICQDCGHLVRGPRKDEP